MRAAHSKLKEGAVVGTKAKRQVAARSSSRKKANTAAKTTKARKRA
jgi:hypothetical protein